MEKEPAEKKLLSVIEAQQRLLTALSPVGTETVSLLNAAGRVLAETVVSPIDLPLFANSSMDGFAIQAGDAAAASRENPVTLSVTGDIPAGQATQAVLKSGQAMRIMTGAPVPEGADAVIPVELTNFQSRSAGTTAPQYVTLYQSALGGENIRPRGQDVSQGEMVLEPGIRLRPQDIGFLAMLGIPKISVYRRPKVALFSTGDELVPVEQGLSSGKIHDSNAYTLVSLIEKYGGEAVNLGIVPDDPDEVRARLIRAVAGKADLIITSAGVSVGAYDFVRMIVEQEGRLNFWRVNMRPGKPLAFGDYQKIPFIGLPGNPVSAFIGFEVFIRPALAILSGLQAWSRSVLRAQVLEPIDSDGRESYLRAFIAWEDHRWTARLTGHQGSGNLRSLVQANALLLIPSGVKSLPAGAEVDAWQLND